jgi:curved DNA-binding protein CbpA
MDQDHYEILGVAPDASLEEITRAYRRLAKHWHPDRNPSPDAEARLKPISAAYNCLKKPKERRAYDDRRAYEQARQREHGSRRRREAEQRRAEAESRRRQEEERQRAEAKRREEEEAARAAERQSSFDAEETSMLITVVQTRPEIALFALALVALTGSGWLMPQRPVIAAAETAAAAPSPVTPAPAAKPAQPDAEAQRIEAEARVAAAIARAQREAEERAARDQAARSMAEARAAEETQRREKEEARRREEQTRRAARSAAQERFVAPFTGSALAGRTVCELPQFAGRDCSENQIGGATVAFAMKDRLSTGEAVRVEVQLAADTWRVAIQGRTARPERDLMTVSFGEATRALIGRVGFSDTMLRICARDRTASFAREGVSYRCATEALQGGVSFAVHAPSEPRGASKTRSKDRGPTSRRGARR